MSRLADLLASDELSSQEIIELKNLVVRLEADVAEAAGFITGQTITIPKRAVFQRALDIYTNGFAATDLSRGILLRTRNDAKVTGYMGLRNSQHGIMTIGVDDALGTNNTASRIAIRHDLVGNTEDGAMFFSGNGRDMVVMVNYDTGETELRLQAGPNDAEITEISLRGGVDSTESVLNEQGRDIDFRIEGDTVTDVFKVDAGKDVAYLRGIGARVYNSGNISINNASDTILTFDSERFDTDTMHSTSSNTGRLTATTAGVYDIKAQIEWAATANTGFRQGFIILNGITNLAAERYYLAANEVLWLNIQTTYELAAGDYVEIQVHQTSGAALNVLYAANVSPEFSMVKVG